LQDNGTHRAITRDLIEHVLQSTTDGRRKGIRNRAVQSDNGYTIMKFMVDI